mgnify:CR=1 FL=1|jgi:RecA/RadA recombinase
MKLIKMNEVQAEKVSWLWYPYIPYGKITLIQGDPGDGKTTFVLAVAALLTNGKPMPECENAAEPVTVIYQTAEDGLADTIRPRLDEVGADCSRVIVIDESEQALTLSDSRIEQAIIKTQAKLLILDPLQAYLGVEVDMHRANEIRPVFKALAGVAERTGCAVVIIGHMNKMNGTKGLYRGLGSIDIAAAVRSILLVGRDKEIENTRIMAHLKSSLAPEGCPIAFELDKDNGFRWVGAYDISVDDLLNGTRSEREPTKEIQAVSLITEMLRDNDLPCNEIYSRLAEHHISRRTAENAKQLAGVRSYKKGMNWYWSLSEKNTATPQ